MDVSMLKDLLAKKLIIPGLRWAALTWVIEDRDQTRRRVRRLEASISRSDAMPYAAQTTSQHIAVSGNWRDNGSGQGIGGCTSARP